MTNKYYLISKNYGQSFIKYKGNVIRLSRQLPYTVDEVVVGVKGKIGQEKRIMTFKDSQGNILERVFDYFNKPLKNQIYTRQDFTKGEDLFITSTTVKEYTLDRAALSIYKTHKEELERLNIPTLLWNKTKIENNHLCENLNSEEKIFSRTSITNIKQPTKQIHTFIEFPHIKNGKRQTNNKTILQFRVDSNKKQATEVITEHNAQMPKQDSFLAFRALDFSEIKEAISNYFIKQRGLSKMNIEVEPEYQPKGDPIDRLIAEFNPGNGFIHFNRYHKFQSKPQLVSTSRHEVEHAWQYYLYARNTGGRFDWEMEIAKRFGEIRNKKLKKEAEKYTKSIDNYVSYLEDYEKYKKNYIEIKANYEGLQARNKYEKEAKEIRKAFPFIPKEML